MLLSVPDDLSLPRATRRLLPSLNLELAVHDGMYQGNDRHYLTCGASALNVIGAALDVGERVDPGSILDFGAGAGRVTRWIRAAFPQAALDCCDLREADVKFCERVFGARPWISDIEIGSLRAPSTYDLIWLGSVVTHLGAERTTELLSKILSWLKPGGLAVFSFHGRRAIERQDSAEFKYIHDSAWDAIKEQYSHSGYGYADYAGQNGYGISVMKLSWLTKLLEARSESRIVLLSETAWDGHHDVLAVQSRSRSDAPSVSGAT